MKHLLIGLSLTTKQFATPKSQANPIATNGQFTVALTNIPGIIDQFSIKVTIGGYVYHMTLDTGCSEMDISSTLAD
jgi:hypothetical protein